MDEQTQKQIDGIKGRVNGYERAKERADRREFASLNAAVCYAAQDIPFLLSLVERQAAEIARLETQVKMSFDMKARTQQQYRLERINSGVLYQALIAAAPEKLDAVRSQLHQNNNEPDKWTPEEWQIGNEAAENAALSAKIADRETKLETLADAVRLYLQRTTGENYQRQCPECGTRFEARGAYWPMCPNCKTPDVSWVAESEAAGKA